MRGGGPGEPASADGGHRSRFQPIEAMAPDGSVIEIRR